MNERDLERALIDWMLDEPAPAPDRLLDVVMAHAGTHPRRSWSARLATAVIGALTGSSGTGEARAMGAVRPRVPWVTGLATAGAIALTVMVAFALVPTPVFVSEPPPSTVPRPLVGSLWQEDTERGREGYVLLHPDGTAMTLTAGPGRQIGIGVWEPTGSRSLVTLIAYPDADPDHHIRYGFSTYREAWTLDDALETATVRWTAHIEPGNGSAASDRAGSTAYRRVHREALPPDALHPVPDEPAWGPVVGSMATGRVDTLLLAVLGCSPSDPADQLLLHGDGTTVYAGLTGGQGLGLWSETGPGIIALTERYGSASVARSQQWVAQLAGSWIRSGRTGTSSSFADWFTATPRTIETIAGPVADEAPDRWPARGTVWLQETDQGMVITALLTDGTVVARDPRYGTGAGFWRPTGAGSLVSSVAYPGRALQDHRMVAESTVDPGWSTLSIRYRHVDRFSGDPPEEGTASAVRLELGS